MTQPFNASANPTVGVEWEIALIDPQTRDLVPRAGRSFPRWQPPTPTCTSSGEFLANTIELVTPVCHNSRRGNRLP